MTAIIAKAPEVVARLRAALLVWYDQNGRDLVWRHGERDPYRVWLSEVMLQQTTTGHAAPYYSRFLQLWPTVGALAAAADEKVMAEWAGLGYYSRARNLIKCAHAVVEDFGGRFPDNEAQLLKLPGFGPYTAAAVAAIAFGKPANVIDGNIERIMTRLYAIEAPLPEGRSLVRAAAAQWVGSDRAGDWPQALMDLSAAICRPKAPLCLLCPLREGCVAFARGDAETFPRKLAKAPKPRRHGVVFVMRCGDGVIVEQRADKGLLGGMLGLPHTEWRAQPWLDAEVQPPVEGASVVAGSYEHVFTHFALSQSVWVTDVDDSVLSKLLRAHNSWRVLPLAEQKSLPTVFRKALKYIDKTPLCDAGKIK